jgi:hypothetical protein
MSILVPESKLGLSEIHNWMTSNFDDEGELSFYGLLKGKYWCIGRYIDSQGMTQWIIGLEREEDELAFKLRFL